ncbi:vWA domain-containing protein [Muriicola sp. Z0-33]|uniref:vWA domain-containing protein n=1 Tax=Muriicola sp. Z0-33 TaxID=2816957 RepID=UPI0022379E7A|nr:vWA domain-containing protein [Muriicola sp. Z0-33]MCW5516718.1 VWA domain-containing protein [Muriicola sp. Z0-33]
MQIATVLLIILSAIIALAIVFYQYFYKTKRNNTLYIPLGLLRFLAIFSCLLLLINPKFTKTDYTLEKANLVLLLDNSSSIDSETEKAQLTTLLETLQSNKEVQDNFRFGSFGFGQFLNASDSLSHAEKTTNISRALSSVNDIYSAGITAVILATDGNQTLGEDYEYFGGKQQLPVYPIVIGDTTRYSDLRIDQLNINKYAFLKNRFPVEIYSSYQGEGNINSFLTITMDGQTVHREQLRFDNTTTSRITNTLITASTVGIKEIKVNISALENEKNLANNVRESAIEVIDEKTNIAIISEVLHPDIGALKKAIESNEQRSVDIYYPGTSVKDLEETDLFILYQPGRSFRTVMQYIKDKGAAKFTITGARTDWRFLNEVQNSFIKNSFNQTEEVFPLQNAGFGIFDASSFSVEDFPPLEGFLGEILITKSHDVILEQQVKGIAIDEPLLSIIGNENEREAVLFGENIWKWRAQSYRNNKDFKNFDDLISRIVLYLSSNAPKSRLTLDYQNTFQEIGEASISASYFDETFVFDNNASISLMLKNTENGASREIPMLLMNGYYKADLSNLPPGPYNFTVKVANENITKSGNFKMLDFDVEKQFFSSDYEKLQRLANATNAELFFPNEVENLIDNLLASPQFVPTQKSNQNVVSLVDFRLLLGIIIASLAAEWFIRKYNGLI